jgi:hypothetical protein
MSKLLTPLLASDILFGSNNILNLFPGLETRLGNEQAPLMMSSFVRALSFQQPSKTAKTNQRQDQATLSAKDVVYVEKSKEEERVNTCHDQSV